MAGPKKTASNAKNPDKIPTKKPTKPSAVMTPKREKIEKGGNALQKYGDVVYVIRMKQNLRIAFVVKASNKSKGAYIQHLVNLIRNGDDSVQHLGIDAIIPRRVSDGSNNRMMDGMYPMRQFLQVLDEEEENSAEQAREWGHQIAKKITDLNRTSTYPTTCSFAGDLTPPDDLPTVDTHLMNADVVNIASHLYKNAIMNGSFFEPICDDEGDEENNMPVSADFFGYIDDPRSLFI